MLRFLRGKSAEAPETPPASSETSTGVFLEGAYRQHAAEDVARFTALAAAAFPEFSARISCFGADWLGRQFAEDKERVVGGERQILLLEPGTGEALEIPVGLSEFHETLLAQEPDAVAALSFFREWTASGGTAPGYDQCIGYIQPLYLGGEDGVANLELTDFEVYWHISAQLLERVRGLPVGTPIGNLTIGD